MEITEADHDEINKALIELDSLYKETSKFSDSIIEKARYICNDACDRPEFFENGFNMDAGLKAVEVYVSEKYPWLTEHAAWIVRHNCMMNMK